jgi:2'-5' RNA ligase
MDRYNSSMPGYNLNEYQVVLLPHEDLRNRINRIKNDFAEKFDDRNAVFVKPHLTLVRFRSWAMSEQKIAQRLQHIGMGTAPFKVQLKDFGSYPTHSLYINVPTKLPVENLVREIRGLQKLMKVHPDHDPHFILDPHITIARKLLPWQYEKAWLEYSQSSFTGHFIADGMLFLKRAAGAKVFEIISRYEFMNLPVETKQGELFG